MLYSFRLIKMLSPLYLNAKQLNPTYSQLCLEFKFHAFRMAKQQKIFKYKHAVKAFCACLMERGNLSFRIRMHI